MKKVMALVLLKNLVKTIFNMNTESRKGVKMILKEIFQTNE